MIDYLENPWILVGKLVSSFVFGTCLGYLLLGRESRNACEETVKESRKAIGFAVMTGSFFTLTVLLRGNPGASGLRDWALFLILLEASIRDFKSYEIPKKALPEGVLLWLLWLIFGGLQGEIPAWAAFLDGALSATVYSLVLLILTLMAEHLFRKETLGGGDIKLIFMVMLHLGFLRGFACIMMSLVFSLTALLMKRSGKIPLAPPIALGTAVSLLLGIFFSHGCVLLFSS
ncbi:MAG: prepilin peptidase [Lachnospiraceae bacterium]|nr:prepilin peptidase [Lachnospiraceae bacterium]